MTAPGGESRGRVTLPSDPRDPDGYPADGPGSLASIGQRAVARIIDTALVAVPLSVVSIVWFSDTSDGEVSIAAPIWVVALFFALDLAYEVTMVRLFGQTLYYFQFLSEGLPPLRSPQLSTIEGTEIDAGERLD